MKIGDFWEGLLKHKLANGISQKTITEYRRLWERVLIPTQIPDTDITKFRRMDADKILEAGKFHGEYGGQRGIVVLRQVLRYIRDEGHNPSVNWWEINVPMKPAKPVQYLEPDEWEKVRNCFDLASFTGLRDKAYVELLWATGMRPSEPLSIDRYHVDWKNKQIRIKNGKPPYHTDLVYLTDDAIKFLKIYLAARNDKFPPLFVSLTGRRMKVGNIRRTLQDALRRSGIKKRVHPYMLRKTYCTNLLFGGADLKSVQYLARHKSERTTLRYYAAVNKTRAKQVHQHVLNKPAESTLHVEEINGQKVLVNTLKPNGVPMVITHARILRDDEKVDKFIGTRENQQKH